MLTLLLLCGAKSLTELLDCFLQADSSAAFSIACLFGRFEAVIAPALPG